VRQVEGRGQLELAVDVIDQQRHAAPRSFSADHEAEAADRSIHGDSRCPAVRSPAQLEERARQSRPAVDRSHREEVLHRPAAQLPNQAIEQQPGTQRTTEHPGAQPHDRQRVDGRPVFQLDVQPAQLERRRHTALAYLVDPAVDSLAVGDEQRAHIRR